MSNMTPVGIPPQAVRNNPTLKAIHVGPPKGMTEEEFGTVESPAGVANDLPVFADYWQPTPEQLAMLNAGGFIELRQYSNWMVMHSMTILPPEGDPTAGMTPPRRELGSGQVELRCEHPGCPDFAAYIDHNDAKWCKGHGYGPVQA